MQGIGLLAKKNKSRRPPLAASRNSELRFSNNESFGVQGSGLEIGERYASAYQVGIQKRTSSTGAQVVLAATFIASNQTNNSA